MERVTLIARKKGNNIIIPIPMDLARATDIQDGTLVAYEIFRNRITIMSAAAAKQEDENIIIWARKEWETDRDFWERMAKTETGFAKKLADLVISFGHDQKKNKVLSSI